MKLSLVRNALKAQNRLLEELRTNGKLSHNDAVRAVDCLHKHNAAMAELRKAEPVKTAAPKKIAEPYTLIDGVRVPNASFKVTGRGVEGYDHTREGR